MSRPGFSLTLLGITILSSVLTSKMAQSHQRILIAFLVRNKAHTLPYFLHYIENLEMPKNLISLWIRADHNIDNSSRMLSKWVANMNGQYNNIDYEHDDSVSAYPHEEDPVDWTDDRFGHVMRLKQAALEAGKQLRVYYLFMIDADVMLTNPLTLQQLMDEDKPIVAPLLTVTVESTYSNFWGEQDDDGYYKRSNDYLEINEGRKRGCFEVAVVHSAILINYRHPQTKRLAYFPPPSDYNGPYDDIIVFAYFAQSFGVKMYILNKFFYGFIPLPTSTTLEEEREQFVHIKTECIVDDGPLQKVSYLYPPQLVDKKDKMGFDEVYLINLERREDRKMKMEQCLQELGLDARIFQAVDGESLNVSYLNYLSVRMIPGYLDPYDERPLKKGEVGCFLSHYAVWKEMLLKGYEEVLIFEDDVRFEPFFRSAFQAGLDEIRKNKIEWDLIYLGRRREDFENHEYRVPKSKYFVTPSYSYWTVAYMLSNKGALKMLIQDPLKKMMALDEYFNVMFDQHPNNEWKQFFYPRNLQAFSFSSLLVYPTRYTAEPGYISDTEASDILNFDSSGLLHEGVWSAGGKITDSIQPEQDGNAPQLRGDTDSLPGQRNEL